MTRAEIVALVAARHDACDQEMGRDLHEITKDRSQDEQREALLAIASSHLYSAKAIFAAVGGPEYAASMLYQGADSQIVLPEGP